MNQKQEIPESASSHDNVRVLVGLVESVMPEGALVRLPGKLKVKELCFPGFDVTSLLSLTPTFDLLP